MWSAHVYTTECSNVCHIVPFNLSRNLNHKLYIDFDLNNRRVRWVLHCQCCNNPGIDLSLPASTSLAVRRLRGRLLVLLVVVGVTTSSVRLR